jgi:uroporphyrinogen decarboxylase
LEFGGRDLASSIASHRERLEVCISGGELDRPAIALWRHFPVDDQSPDTLAEATVNFQRDFDFDLVKVSPSSSFCIRDWGAKDEWRGLPEGTRDYTDRVVQHPEDWERLHLLDPYNGSLSAQIKCLRLIAAELSREVPIIQTIFSPLAQAKNLVGPDNLLIHVRRYPQALKSGLKIITESEYEIFGRSYDLQVLDAAQDLWLNMLHLHGKQIMFKDFLDYPVAIINWHDRETPPSLAEAKKKFPGALCGGLRRWQTMVLGTPDSVTAEAEDAIQTTGGQKLILGTGCVMPTIVPRGNILAARQSVEK